MLKKLLASLVMAVMIFVGGWGYAGDFFLDEEVLETPALFQEFVNEDGSFKEYVDLKQSVVGIETIGSVESILRTRISGYTEEGKWESKITHEVVSSVFHMRASGFVVENEYTKQKYIITADHVVNPSFGKAFTDDFISQTTWPLRILHRTIVISDGLCLAEVIYEDPEEDWAVLKPIGNPRGLKPLPYEVTYQGMYGFAHVATIVRERDEEGELEWWYTVRFGRLQGLIFKPPHPDFPIHEIPWFSMSDVPMSLAILPGDSGSPVFGFKNGRPVIIGIARAYATHKHEIMFYMADAFIIEMIVKGKPLK